MQHPIDDRKRRYRLENAWRMWVERTRAHKRLRQKKFQTNGSNHLRLTSDAHFGSDETTPPVVSILFRSLSFVRSYSILSSPPPTPATGGAITQDPPWKRHLMHFHDASVRCCEAATTKATEARGGRIYMFAALHSWNALRRSLPSFTYIFQLTFLTFCNYVPV